MEKNIKYYKIINFRHSGDLGINKDVLVTIVTKSINEIEGVKLCVPHTIFQRGPIFIKIGRNSNVYIKLRLSIEYGQDLEKSCLKVQEKIEHDLMYMCEIKPKKIEFKIDKE